MPVRRELQFPPDRQTKHSHILIIPDDVLIQFDLLMMNAVTHFFVYLFISCLYMFRASQRSSSEGRIVLIHNLACLVCVSDCLVCRSGIPSSHLHRLIISDVVLIQFDLLMMSAVTLETCRDMK